MKNRKYAIIRRMKNEITSYFEELVILIPAYNPSKTLKHFVHKLKNHFSRIVIVNDGSTQGLDVIDEISRLAGVEILTHPQNRGKGAALKSGFNRIGKIDTITADADGQHAVHDIIKVAQALKHHRDGLVLGVRTFKGNVPLRSRFGNFWTKIFFFIFTALWIKDTQTGLRGIPAELMEKIINLPGNGYEYEMAVLTNTKSHRQKPLQVPIDTIYEKNNASSHFSPLSDTVKIYRAMFAELIRLKRRPRTVRTTL